MLTDEARKVLKAVHEALAGLDDWTKEATEQALRSVAETRDVKLGKLAQPLARRTDRADHLARHF